MYEILAITGGILTLGLAWAYHGKRKEKGKSAFFTNNFKVKKPMFAE